MTLYESNYIRLGWLVPELRRLRGSLVSQVAGEPALELSVVEQCRYTTAFQMTYVFSDEEGMAREPQLDVAVVSCADPVAQVVEVLALDAV